MEHNKGGGFVANGNVLMGAIFMANRMTKKECIERKLFGLPASQTAFVKTVKAGMLLFLFEHEERKLYGIFEATSHGALNIIPSAFLSSGKSFPAQVHMKRIWMCKPLCEDEFFDAIRENYYTHNKFHFGLSYEQVLKLVELFSCKKINLCDHRSFSVHNKSIKGFEKSGMVNTRVNGKDASVKFCSIGHDVQSDLESSGFHGIRGHQVDNSMYEKNPIQSSENNKFSVRPGCQSVPHTFSELLASNPLHSTSKSSDVLVAKFPCSFYPDGRQYYNVAGYVGDHSAALGMSNSPLAQELALCSRPSMGSETANFRSKSQLLQANLATSDWPSGDYLSLDVSGSHGINECRLGSAQKSSRAHPSFIRSDHYTGLEDCRNVLPDHYNSSSSEIYCTRPGNFASRGTDFLPSMLSPGNAQYYLEASQPEDGSGGNLSWQSGSYPNYIPLSENVEEVEVSRFIRPRKALTGMHYSPTESEKDDNYKQLKPFHLRHGNAEHYASAANPDPHSDAYQGKTSVFSRLSRAPEVWKQGRTFRTEIGVGQLVDLLAQRRNAWNKGMSITIRDDEDIERADEESFDPNNESVAEDWTEQPIFNFKRRSEVSKVAGEHRKGSNVESGEKCKRRRLVRPSFGEAELMNKEITNENKQELSRENGGIASGAKDKDKRDDKSGSPFRSPENSTEIAGQVSVPKIEGQTVGESGTFLGIVLEESMVQAPFSVGAGHTNIPNVDAGKDAGGSMVLGCGDSHISMPCSEVASEASMNDEGNENAEARLESGTMSATDLKESRRLSNLLEAMAGPSGKSYDGPVEMDPGPDGYIELFPLKSDAVRASILVGNVKSEQGITEWNLDVFGDEKLDLQLYGNSGH